MRLIRSMNSIMLLKKDGPPVNRKLIGGTAVMIGYFYTMRAIGTFLIMLFMASLFVHAFRGVASAPGDGLPPCCKRAAAASEDCGEPAGKIPCVPWMPCAKEVISLPSMPILAVVPQGLIIEMVRNGGPACAAGHGWIVWQPPDRV